MWGNNAQVIKDIIDATDESTVLEHNMHVRHPDSLSQGFWGKGRVTLVGDAAHPMHPASGMPHLLLCMLCPQLTVSPLAAVEMTATEIDSIHTPHVGAPQLAGSSKGSMRHPYALFGLAQGDVHGRLPNQIY